VKLGSDRGHGGWKDTRRGGEELGEKREEERGGITEYGPVLNYEATGDHC